MTARQRATSVLRATQWARSENRQRRGFTEDAPTRGGEVGSDSDRDDKGAC